MVRPLKIYIAGPYTAQTEELRLRNVNAAVDAAIALFFKGHFPYVPHLTHFVDARAKDTGTSLRWEDYIRWDMPWVGACDALLYLSGSRGADLELEAAKASGKHIFYSVDEVLEADEGASHGPPQTGAR